MPLVVTIEQLLAMSDGAAVDAFKGRVQNVYPIATKTGQYGEYTLQKLILSENGKTIEVMMKNRPQVPTSMKGSVIYAQAVAGERGLTGLKRTDNVWKDKTTPQVWITDAAEVSFEGNTSGQQQSSPPPQNQNQQRQSPPQNGGAPAQSRAPAPPADPGAARAAAMKDFNKRIGRASSALNRCFDAAFELVKEVNKRHGEVCVIKPTPELMEKIAMGLMVNACWTAKPSDIEAFPSRPFQFYEQTSQNGQTNGHANGHGQHQPAGAGPRGSEQGAPLS